MKVESLKALQGYKGKRLAEYFQSLTVFAQGLQRRLDFNLITFVTF